MWKTAEEIGWQFGLQKTGLAETETAELPVNTGK
jgi:hypothetical protein